MKKLNLGKKLHEMDAKKRRALIVTTAIILAVVIVLAAVAVVHFTQNRVVDPVLEYKDAKLSLAFYSLMLSKTKGNLARAGYEVTKVKFWEAESTVKGKTNAEYYTERTMETCKLYLLSAYLFDKEGLKLPESYYAEIDQEIEDCISLGYIGGGSEEKFNEILMRYGFTVDDYREALILKSKAEYLQTYLFGSGGSKISDELKEEYYENYYYRFKQIFVAKYYYTYEVDEFGYEMYFSGESNTPLYDQENGKVAFDENNKYLRDKYGEVIYFEVDENGEPIEEKPLYDTENGVKHPVRDEDGVALKHYYTDAEIAEKYQNAMNIMSSVNKGNFATFEAQMEKFNDAADSAAQYSDGYYLSSVTSNGYGDYAYLNDILAKLIEMEVGELDIVESSEGYHIVMKYELDAGAFADDDKSVWFDNFTATVMTNIFKTKYSDILENIEINEENLAKAESIIVIGTNYDYWK